MRTLGLIFLFFTSFHLKSQITSYTDSIDKVLIAMPDDTIKFKVYDYVIDTLMQIYPKRSLPYCAKALKLANQLNSIPLKALINNYYGMTYYYNEEYEKSLDYLFKAIRLNESIKNYKGVLLSYDYLIRVYFISDQEKARIYLAKEAELISKSFNEKKELWVKHFGKKSSFYKNNNEFDSALVYAKKMLQLDKLMPKQNPYVYCKDYSHVGLMYKLLGKYNLALNYYDSCKYILDTLPKSDFVNTLYSYNNNNFGYLYSSMGKYKEALKSFQKSNEYAEKIGNLTTMKSNYEAFAATYGLMGDYKNQVLYLQKYYAIKDSLFSIDNKVKMVELESEYEIEKRNATIFENEKDLLKQKYERNILLAVISVVGLVSLLLVWFYKRLQHKNKLLATQNQQIIQQKEQLVELNQVKDRLFSIISHDLRQPVAALKTYLNLLDSQSLPIEKAEKYKSQVAQSVNNLKDMLDNLLIWSQAQVKKSAPVYSTFSLKHIIEDTISEIKPQAEMKQIHIDNNVNLDQVNTDINVISVAVRNLLTNAVKFSQPGGTIKINLDRNNEAFHLSVYDEGVGLSPSQIEHFYSTNLDSTQGTQGEKGSGLGLYLVKELVQRINGRIIVKSEINRFTEFTIVFPNRISS